MAVPAAGFQGPVILSGRQQDSETRSCTLLPNGVLDEKSSHHVMEPANVSTSVPLKGYWEDVSIL